MILNRYSLLVLLLLFVIEYHSREVIPRLAVAYRLAYGCVLVENPVEVLVVEIIKFWVLLHGELLDVSAGAEVGGAVEDNLAPT